MKIFIITQQEPFFIYKVVKQLLEDNNHRVVGGTVLKAKRVNKSRWSYIRERTSVYTMWELFWVTYAYVICKMKGRKITSLLHQHQVPAITTEDVNNREYIAKVKATQPDVIVSISPPQLFKKELLEAAPHCLNAHASLLPRHRGVFGTWWTLFHGDKEAGITIHTMDEAVDKGEIMWQERISVQPGETQFSLAYRTKALIAPSVWKCMKLLESKQLKPMESKEEPSYNYAPTKADEKQFRRKGCRVFSWSDLRLMLKDSY